MAEQFEFVSAKKSKVKLSYEPSGNIKISDKMAFQDLHNGPEWHFYGL
jgi:hypothetical protein